jgi:hypothetical protein
LVRKVAMLEQEWRGPRGLRRFLDQVNVQVFRDGRVESRRYLGQIDLSIERQ